MSPRAVIRGGVLAFAAVEAADEGEYTCRALNTHGEHTARASLLVQSTSLRHARSRGQRFWGGGSPAFLLQGRAPAVRALSLRSRSALKTSKSTKGTR